MSTTERVKTEILKARIARSLDQLRIAMEWTQKEMADKLMIAAGTLSNYINTDNNKIPDLECLVNLCRLEDFKKKGLDLSVEALLSPNFNPVEILKQRNGAVIETKANVKHSDFLGTYLCYFFDQTKSLQEQYFKATRELRYGVISIYDDHDGPYGEGVLRVCASFYKEYEFKKALEMKASLDSFFFSDIENGSINDRNEKIRGIYSDVFGTYTGTVDFSDQHAFISIQNNVINDRALIILYSPRKRADSEYVGGIGSVTSVAHGRNHMPTAQKMILSKYEINCSNEEIAEHLNMSDVSLSTTNEAKALSELCEKLYERDSAATIPLDENDKIAIITNRMNQLVRNYIEKTVCSVGSISEEEDKRVYTLIKKHAK